MTFLQRNPPSPTTSPRRTLRRSSHRVGVPTPRHGSGAASIFHCRRRRRRHRSRFVSLTFVIVVVGSGRLVSWWLSCRVVPFFFVVVDRNFDLVRGTP